VSQLLTMCVQLPQNADHNAVIEMRFNRVLALKTTLQRIPGVAATLQSVKAPLLVNMKEVSTDAGH